MNLWTARKKSLHWLNNELKPENKVLQEGFDYLGTLVGLFETIGRDEGDSETGQFCRIISITLAKSCHLLLGSYSLILDGLAQEAGALLRPIIETYELLVYFRLDKSRISEFLEGNLPSPGKIGKDISGNMQNIRDYLNVNASHFSYKSASVRHLFDKNAKIRPTPFHSLKVLRTNLQTLNGIQFFVISEACYCLFSRGFDENELTNGIEKWRNTSAEVFPLEKTQL